MRIGGAQWDFLGGNGERFLVPGYGGVPRTEWLCCYRAPRCFPDELAFGTRATMVWGGYGNRGEYDYGWGILGSIVE